MYRLAASNISISVYTQHYIITKGLVEQSDKRIKKTLEMGDNYKTTITTRYFLCLL